MIFFENSKFCYRRTFWQNKHLVKNKASGLTRAASRQQIEKLAMVFQAIETMPWPSPRASEIACLKVYIAFCLTVHEVEPIGQTFLSQPPKLVALTFGTMPAD